MSVRLYFEAKPVHSVICCCAFVYFLLARFSSPFSQLCQSGLRVFFFIWPAIRLGSGTAQLRWLILIKWTPEAGEVGSSEYGKASHEPRAATLPLLTLAFPRFNVKEWESMRSGKTTEGLIFNLAKSI